MQTYTYTIYDGDPSRSGPCAWPSHQLVEMRGRSLAAIKARVAQEMTQEGRACGAYASGDRLWANIWDEAGVLVASPTVTL